MAYDEGLAQRIRDLLDERRDVTEKKMFGGIAFLVGGHMSVGIIKDDLMVRVRPDAHDRLVREPHARDMDFTGRPMKGYLYVAPRGVASDAGLRRWVERGVAFATSLPPKAGRPATRRARR